MRLLGYYDAYLGFLSHVNFRAPAGNRVLDVGCGTGAFADAWAAIHGPHQDIALLDPSAEMLDRAAVALRRRAIDATRIQGLLEEHEPVEPYHCLLAAHVIEHAAVAVDALREMRALVPNGGRLWLVVSKPHWCNAIIWFQWRHRAYRPSDVHHMLADSGWALEAEYPFPSGPPSRTSRGYLAKAV
ncbi:MAG: class I SAM-dependent methyltransferase [Pseudomonadota bacterium]